MQKTHFDYLFGENTLYRVPEPEPVLTPPPPTEAGLTVPEPPAVLNVVEPEAIASPPAEPEPAPKPKQPALHVPLVPKVNHKILLLFDEELLPSELILLENILKAVNLNLEGVDRLNLAGLGLVNVRPILAKKHVHHFISFGVPFTKLNLNITLNRYEIQTLAGIDFLLADPLSAIEADQKLKRSLWLCLQRLFLRK